jgi:hypothetical protein
VASAIADFGPPKGRKTLLDYVTSNGRLIMNAKGSGRGLISGIKPVFGRTEEKHDKPKKIQDVLAKLSEVRKLSD